MNVRAVAAQALGQVLGEGRSLAVVLPAALERVAPRDRGLLWELCHGACRWQPELQPLLDGLLTRPLDPRESVTRALLLVGLYQLLHLRIPDHAAVAETVAAARQLRKPWAVGLTNAVLRSFSRRHVNCGRDWRLLRKPGRLIRAGCWNGCNGIGRMTGQPSSPPTTPAPPSPCGSIHGGAIVTTIGRGWRRWASRPSRSRRRQRR